ncbi:MAG TPA: ABC transporter ATP-binding protein [Longimicrobiales bacterium]|nr:ABC transporter ATP-binding protein [Longimicrobiales bacterium]
MTSGPEETEVYSLSQNLKAILRLRPFFMPFLLPAIGLLLLALLQADFATTAAKAGGSVIDALAVPAAEATSLDAPPPPPAPGDVQERRALTPVSIVFERFSGGASALRLALLLAILLFISEAFSIWIDQMRSKVSVRFRDGMQRKLVESLSRETWLTRGKRTPGNTSQIVTQDAGGLSGLLIFGVVRAAEDIIRMGVFIFALCLIPGGVRVAIVVVPLAIIFQAAVSKMFLAKQARLNQESENMVAGLRGRSVEFFQQLGNLIYFKGERQEGEKMLKASYEGAEANRRFQLVAMTQGSVSATLSLLALPLVIILLGSTLAGNPGTAVQAQMIVMTMFAAITALSQIPSTVASYSPSLRRVEDALNVPPVEPKPAELDTLLAAAKPQLAVRDLTFGYPGTARPLIRNLTVDIPSGARVGIIADNGTGKSTLARLLVGDLQPDTGRILLDGVDVTDWHLHWRRELVGFMPVNPGFLTGSLYDNIVFGRAPEDLSDAQRAIEICDVATFADANYGGVHTALQKNPADLLSSGQQKQLGIARLVAGRQRVWILDEPGANLSALTMRDIASVLRRASEGRTTFIITHDPDVFVTDFNLYFENGVLAAVGTHDELQRTNAGYQTLVNRYVHEREEQEAEGELQPAGAPADAGPDIPEGFEPPAGFGAPGGAPPRAE